MVLDPDTLFHGRYSVVRCLKVGGMGAVYEVVDRATQSRRALKVLLPDILKSADLRRRFEREATITGSIESDHVVHTTDAGLDEATGMPFLVMELLRGEELAAVVARSGHLRPDEAMLYLRQAALGLDKVHAAGIVHRDLKPENLFIVLRDDGSPCLKIIDFGVAKEVAPAGELGKTRVIGTPLFMAPEQIRGDGRIGPSADLYALGHVAYVLLTGEPYWAEEAGVAASIQAFVEQVVQGPVEPPGARALRRTGVVLPPGFDGWFARANAALPEQRFGHASEAVAALAEALGIPAGTPREVSRSSGPSGPSGVDAARAPLHAPIPAPLTPQPAQLARTTSPVTGEAAVRTPAPSQLRLTLPLAAVALLIVGVAAIALGPRLITPDDTAHAVDREPAPAAPAPAAPEPAPPPASPPASATPAAPGDAAPSASGDAAPAAPAGASPSASAASKPHTGAAPSPARPAPRHRPGDTTRAPRHPGID